MECAGGHIYRYNQHQNMFAHLLFELLDVSATFCHPIAGALGSTNFALVPGWTTFLLGAEISIWILRRTQSFQNTWKIPRVSIISLFNDPQHIICSQNAKCNLALIKGNHFHATTSPLQMQYHWSTQIFMIRNGMEAPFTYGQRSPRTHKPRGKYLLSYVACTPSRQNAKLLP